MWPEIGLRVGHFGVYIQSWITWRHHWYMSYHLHDSSYQILFFWYSMCTFYSKSVNYSKFITKVGENVILRIFLHFFRFCVISEYPGICSKTFYLMFRLSYIFFQIPRGFDRMFNLQSLQRYWTLEPNWPTGRPISPFFWFRMKKETIFNLSKQNCISWIPNYVSYMMQ